MRNRRQAARRRAQRWVRLRFIGALHAAHADRPEASLAIVGHTRDISAKGLALVVPSMPVDEGFLLSGDCTLRIDLELPAVHVMVVATPVRYEKLAADATGAGHLIGARIEEVHDEGQFAKYLRGLSRKSADDD
jgi:hypothetical protein